MVNDVNRLGIDSMKRRVLAALAPVLALVAACSVLVAGPAHAAVPDAGQDCIQTPQQYERAWKQHAVRCVAPGLFGTVHDPGSKAPYPSGFWKAWAVGSSELEQYLVLNRREADRPERVGLGILTAVGFSGLEDWKWPETLAVYSLPKGTDVQVPSFASWFTMFQERLRTLADLPQDAQLEIVRAYTTLESDVVQAFDDVTGCSREALLAGSAMSREIGCSESFMDTLAAVGQASYDSRNTKKCLKRYATRYDGPRDAASLRAVLYRCQDAGFLFTGAGWGYNTYANPFICGSAAEQSVTQRYMGREYVLPNLPFAKMDGHVDIPLNLGSVGERSFLTEGYC
ncbi:MAG: hypothetical protein K9G80_06310 [Candidatus Nanopelagicales bacterium]|nr:hypothetical protein [Candidatus Nanopelagicales bacterium]MCF8557785.1 hypothetical protein [Candidatus Nanopelagicales bacterium]